jgi:hypothetical protein
MDGLTEERLRGIIKGFSELETSERKSRLSRLLALDSIRTVEVYTGLMPEPADSIDSFVTEAVEAYVNGLYRSCIFSCATAVHHIFIEVLLAERDRDMQALGQLHRLRFRDVIDEIRKRPLLQAVAEDADWLRKTRNKVAAHSFHVTTGVARSQDQLRFEIESMVRDARALISCLEPQDKIRVEAGTVTCRNRTITFGQALQTEDRVGAEVVWHDLQVSVIPALAFEAYKRMYRVMKRLQIYVTTRYHTRATYETTK